MPLLTLRLTKKENAALLCHAKEASLSPAAFVKRMIVAAPLATAGDVLTEVERRSGDKSLCVRPPAQTDTKDVDLWDDDSAFMVADPFPELLRFFARQARHGEQKAAAKCSSRAKAAR